jgi:hypothetical protein
MMNERQFEGLRWFHPNTCAALSSLFNLHVNAEILAESIRELISRSPYFNPVEVFGRLDQDANGIISLAEF